MRVMLDIDGVCYDFDASVRRALEEHRGYAPGALVASRWWNHIAEQMRSADLDWVWRGPGLNVVFGYADGFIPGAPRAMRRIAAEHDLVFITHRPRSAAPATAAWLAHHRVHFAELHILPIATPKSSVTPVCDVYVDDRTDNVDELLRTTGADVFMPIRDYNVGYDWQGPDPRRFHRYRRIGEVVSWIRANA